MLLSLSLTSCLDDQQPPVIVDENSAVEDFKIEKDTTMVKVLSLPVYIDSTDYIYHPIKLINAAKKDERKSFLSYDNEYSSDNNRNNYASYGFVGAFAGFAVENIKTGNIIKLTNQEIRFSGVRIYNKLEYNPRVEFVIYEGYNLDTNKDSKLDYQDRSALFISNLDGSNFTKLSEDFEEYQNYTFIVENDKLYFQTIKDINKDGRYENNDEYRNYVVDLKASKKIAVRYDLNPVFSQNSNN